MPFEGKLRAVGVEESTIRQYRSAAEQSAMAGLQRLAADAGLAPGASTLCVLQGDPPQRILEQEQEQNCDLIAIGKHGRSVIEETLLGSVTKHVLAQANGDVLVSTYAAS